LCESCGLDYCVRRRSGGGELGEGGGVIDGLILYVLYLMHYWGFVCFVAMSKQDSFCARKLGEYGLFGCSICNDAEEGTGAVRMVVWVRDRPDNKKEG